jgi:hypothetical protein
VQAALVKRDVDSASQAARDILYFMQGEVARIMLAQGRRTHLPRSSPADYKLARKA